MSAFILAPEDIAIIAVANNTDYDGEINIPASKADALQLINDNVASVCARYQRMKPETAVSEFWPDLNCATFNIATSHAIDALVKPNPNRNRQAESLKAWSEISSYLYNACEHDEWEGSPGQLIALKAAYWVAYRQLEAGS